VIGVGREFFVGVVDIVEEDSRGHGSCLGVIGLLRLVSVDGRLQRLRGSFAVAHIDRVRVMTSCTVCKESFVEMFRVGRFRDDVGRCAFQSGSRSRLAIVGRGFDRLKLIANP
jgi:hypothetical protein